MTIEPDNRRRIGGRYRVDGLLGRGGMSEVHYGYDERLDRQVAIKVLRPRSASVPAGPDSPEAVEILDELERDRKRFLREIRTTARLEHPGTPAVYDTGTETAANGDTELWVVMQLLRGVTLEAVLDRTDCDALPMPVSWAAATAAQIAAVLADVHRVDVVHRDIKPANVMIVDGGIVKVLDFGIAILHGAGALPRLTQVDRTVGTPPYMSPEQCLGRPVAAASDIYSLGCLLFELLVGDPPFLGTADEPLRSQHIQSPVPSVRKKRAEVPAEIDALLAAMLSKQSQHRPTAEAVYESLAPFARQAADAAGRDDRDPTRPFHTPLLSPGRRVRTTNSRPSLTDAEFVAVQARVEVLLDAEQPAEAVSILEEAVERAGHDRALHLRLRQLLAASLFVAGEFTRAGPLFDAVGRDYRVLRSPSDMDVLDCAYHAGHAFAEAGRPDKAVYHLRFFLCHATDKDPERILESRFALAQVLAATGRTGEALDELEAVRPLLAATFGAHASQVRTVDKYVARLRSATGGPA